MMYSVAQPPKTGPSCEGRTLNRRTLRSSSPPPRGGGGRTDREKIEPRNVRFSVRPDGVGWRSAAIAPAEPSLEVGTVSALSFGSDNDGRRDQ